MEYGHKIEKIREHDNEIEKTGAQSRNRENQNTVMKSRRPVVTKLRRPDYTDEFENVRVH